MSIYWHFLNANLSKHFIKRPKIVLNEKNYLSSILLLAFFVVQSEVALRKFMSEAHERAAREPEGN